MSKLCLVGFVDRSPVFEFTFIEFTFQLHKINLSFLYRLESYLFVQKGFLGAFNPNDTISLLCPRRSLRGGIEHIGWRILTTFAWDREDVVPSDFHLA